MPGPGPDGKGDVGGGWQHARPGTTTAAAAAAAAAAWSSGYERGLVMASHKAVLPPPLYHGSGVDGNGTAAVCVCAVCCQGRSR